MAGGRDRDEGDDLETVQLDEAFVRAAPVVELSAAERVELLGLVPLRPQVPEPASAQTTSDRRSHGQWRRRRSRRLRVMALLAVGSLAGSAIWTLLVVSMGDTTNRPRWAERARGVQIVTGAVPTPSAEPSRPLEVVDQPRASGTYRFVSTRTDGTTPVGFDPCREVHWVAAESVDRHLESLIGRAFGDVSAASGLKFVQDAPTDETPSARRQAYQPQRYGDRWAPLLVAVAPIEGTSATSSPTVVDSSIDVAKLHGAEWIVSGAITFDGDGMALLSTDALQLRVLRHAIGHLVGLDDVAASSEVMHPGSTGERGFAAGDRRGLARLGAIPCAGS